MPVHRVFAAATACLTTLAMAGSSAETQPDCTPAESATCAGSGYRQELQMLSGMVQLKLQKLVQSLPEEPFDRINLPSKASMQTLQRAWQGYVDAYCDVYWHLWPGASPWKSAESVECQVEQHRRFVVFIDRVQACTAADSRCNLLACTPFDCKPTKN